MVVLTWMEVELYGKQKGSYAFGDVFFEVNIYIQSYLA